MLKVELLYIWIKNDDNDCFKNQGFNFSPKYTILYDEGNNNLKIEKIDLVYNIFAEKNILNINAIVGENGTGKTTLLNYVLRLPLTEIKDEENDTEYKKFNERKKLKNSFIAVYLINNKTKIINHTNHNIIFDNKEVLPFNYKKDDINFEQSLSKILISNSEYSNERNCNLRECGVVNSITITNQTLKGIAKEFYSHISGEFIAHSVDDSGKDLFQTIQTIINNRNGAQELQSIIDVLFYKRIHKQGKIFLGKDIKEVKVNILDFIKIIKEYLNNRNNNNAFEKWLGKFIENFESKWAIKNKADVIKRNYILESCCVNEFSSNEFDGLNLEDAYNLCFEKNRRHGNEYYEKIKQEVDKYYEVFKETRINDNSLPVNIDLAYTEWFEVDIDILGELLENISEQQEGLSFLCKYLILSDFGHRDKEPLMMSSGERALLNMFSRIELSEFLGKVEKRQFKLCDNMLLLLDELDLYLHPEWQRNIVTQMIRELNELFKDKNIQILFSTHSPLILSDIPKANTIWLKYKNGNIELSSNEAETFAANIYDLYKNSFFLNCFIGEFAKEKINKTIKKVYILYKDILDYKIKKLANENANLSKATLKSLDDENISCIKQEISIIGDNFIRQKLFSMLDEIQEVINIYYD